MLPDREPIIRPSSGVIPMVVSTERPLRIAVAEHPLSRCRVTAVTSCTCFPTAFAYCSTM